MGVTYFGAIPARQQLKSAFIYLIARPQYEPGQGELACEQDWLETANRQDNLERIRHYLTLMDAALQA